MLLPDPKRRGEIHFVLLKSLPYTYRLLLAIVLLALGFALQAFLEETLGLIAGAVPLFAASLLMIVKGYNASPGSLRGKREWRSADIDQLRNVIKIANRARKWDQSVVDITCVSGFFTLLLVGSVVALAYWFFTVRNEGWLAIAVIVDAAALLLPHWVTGVRRILTNPPLEVRVKQLLAVYWLWDGSKKEGERMMPQIEVSMTKKGDVPRDAKIIMDLEQLGDTFLGVQVQVVLNNVQGRDYPYVYCVLVARKELRMLQKLSPEPPMGVVAEPKRQKDVDVLVVRQKTSKTSGYHTGRGAVAKIFMFARDEARKLIDT